MKRAKQKHRPAGVSSEYVVFLPPESDIYKALRGVITKVLRGKPRPSDLVCIANL